MKNLVNKVIIFALINVFLLSGCGARTSPLISPTSSPTATVTFTPAPTSTPTFTPTPIPVSIKDAISQGTFSEIKTFGKEIIQQSIFSQNGSLFIAVVSRGIHIYDTKNWQEVKYIPASVEKKVTAIDFSVDGNFFAVGDASGNVNFLDTETWEILKSIKAYEGQITGLKISPDGLNFIVIGDRKTISAWDFNKDTLIVSREQKETLNTVRYSSDGQWILTSAGDGLFTRKASNLEIENRIDYMSGYAASPFKNLFAFINGKTILIKDLDTRKFLVKLETEYSFPEYLQITDIAFIDENLLAIKSKNTDFVSLVDIETSVLKKVSASEFSQMTKNNPLAYNFTKKKEILSLGFNSELTYIPNFISSDGNTFILRSPTWWNDSNIIAEELWQENSSTKSMQMGSGYRMELTTNNESLVVVKWKKEEKQGDFTILNIKPNDLNVLAETHYKYEVKNKIEAVALSPDGKLLAAGTIDGTLYLWDMNKKTQIAVSNAHKNRNIKMLEIFAFSSILFSPDNSLVATYGTDSSFKVWNVQDGKEITSIANTEFANVIFSPDSKSLFYAKKDGVHMKAIYENKDEIALNGNSPDEYLSLLRFSADGSLLFGWGSDTTSRLKVWSVTDKKLLTDIPLFDWASCIALSPDETMLYIATRDGIVSAWGHTPK